jgi:hypothetical protein
MNNIHRSFIAWSICPNYEYNKSILFVYFVQAFDFRSRIKVYFSFLFFRKYDFAVMHTIS